ncbi:MAG TPA: PhzF family phenazine biosynthesis protein [Polyangia bacterium]|nr:PhzF family phenazine biosynthesis protein [Polyangia bacterium]
MGSFPFVVCDVFTDRALTGNQLAVFTDAQNLDYATMQALAREVNFSESTFVLPPESGGDARIRIFTPRRELPFAGHPTLGSAFVLAELRKRDQIVLETARGPIPVAFSEQKPRSRPTLGWMRQPTPAIGPFATETALLDALGIREAALPIEEYDNGPRHVCVAVDSMETVANLRPNMERLSLLGGLCISVFAGQGAVWKTRMFAPGEGIPEDPATGAAAGPIAVHLARHGRIPYGLQITIEQGAEVGRPSKLYASCTGTAERIYTVEVGGSCVTVARGTFTLPER